MISRHAKLLLLMALGLSLLISLFADRIKELRNGRPTNGNGMKQAVESLPQPIKKAETHRRPSRPKKSTEHHYGHSH